MLRCIFLLHRGCLPACLRSLTSPGLLVCHKMRTGIVLVKQEGMLALWSGLPPALARGFLYGGEGSTLAGDAFDAWL